MFYKCITVLFTRMCSCKMSLALSSPRNTFICRTTTNKDIREWNMERSCPRESDPTMCSFIRNKSFCRIHIRPTFVLNASVTKYTAALLTGNSVSDSSAPYSRSVVGEPFASNIQGN